MQATWKSCNLSWNIVASSCKTNISTLSHHFWNNLYFVRQSDISLLVIQVILALQHKNVAQQTARCRRTNYTRSKSLYCLLLLTPFVFLLEILPLLAFLSSSPSPKTSRVGFPLVSGKNQQAIAAAIVAIPMTAKGSTLLTRINCTIKGAVAAPIRLVITIKPIPLFLLVGNIMR